MKKIFTILSFCFLLIKNSFAQQGDSSFQLIKTFTNDIATLAVDNLDNLYIQSPSGQLKKYNFNGDSIAIYNNIRRYGQLQSIDVSNPLKVVLFHKDFSTIVILDRLLSERTSIDLRKQNIIQVSAVGLSYDNNIWIFDEYENKLKKINDDGTVLMESNDFRSTLNLSILPQQIIDQNRQVYLYDPANGLFVFDHYGTFQRKIPITNWKSIVIKDKIITGIFNNGLTTYNTSTLLQSQKSFPSSFSSFTSYIISNTKLFAVKKDALTIYSLNF